MVSTGEAAARRVFEGFGRSATTWPRAELASAHGAAGLVWREEYAALAFCLCEWLCVPSGPRLLGVSGGQGTGKSTLSASIALAARLFGKRAEVLSIDDLYRTRAERQALARDVHPLLATRGVPGTHDVALGQATFDRLLDGSNEVDVPVFDKGRDDRGPPRRARAPVDLLVFEGWCVGIRPQAAAALADPVNALERLEDVDGRWRQHVNAALAGEYATLFGRLSRLVALLPPDFGAVRRWRGWQEQQLPPERRMDAAKLDRFVAHYERLTRHGIATLPQVADVCVHLDAEHAVDTIVRAKTA